MSDELTTVTDDSFESSVLQASLPTLVDFWAPWCAPCRRIAPVVEGVAKEYTGKVNFVKINVSDNQETPSKYNVRGIPTLILFMNGKAVATHVGGDLSKSSLASFIDSNI
ncbi:MAG TPA: thioredoxin [Gammaproteobacteria bacterium]|nr:thioredoxin [Gammaproteobacteria bacterium]